MEVSMTGFARNIACFVILSAGTLLAAAPVEKTGDCPTLERQPPFSGDDWSQFKKGGGAQPTSEFVTNCSSTNQSGCTLQKPLKAAQSINCIVPAAGLKLQLFASEEMVGNMKYIQHFSFDERGRVWAVEPRSYPNTIRSASSTPSITDQKFVGGNDRIVILEDTDGDKVMDKFTVFRDGLNLPQSIECVNGGVVVSMTPYVVFFPNKNDTAGTPVILFSGMGATGTTWDTHGGINQLMYGLDNWIYGLTGYNACKAMSTEPGFPAAGVDCGSGHSWRFRHTALGHAKTEFQVWTGGPANADGLGQMEDGQIFQSGATGTSHLNHSAVQGSGAIDIRTTNPANNATSNPKNVYYPITGDRYLWEGSTDKNSDGWFTSQSTSSSGMQFYTSRLFPKKFWNRFAFTCEGSQKLCNQDSLVESGSTWKGYRLPGPTHANLVASTDAWVAPLLAKTGPDGAVWVLDWNNYLFLHNPAGPPGDGGAWKNDLRTKNSNRIYRMLPTDATPEPVLNLANATEDQLIAAFGSQNFFWRLTAQRLLIGKGATATAIAKLTDILKTNKELDEVGNSPRVQHALWTLDGMGEFTKTPATYIPILQGLLKHPAWCVRRNALRVMPRTLDGAAAINTACSVNDAHAHVRLQALLAFREMKSLPTSLNPIQASFASLDTTASSAQKASGIATGTPACTVTLDASTPFVASTTATSSRRLAQAPREGLKFYLQAGGFRLQPHRNLTSGVITVSDLKGRVAFTSRYDASTASWSVPLARGLHEPVYGYSFRGSDGYSQSGLVTMAGNP
jgi:putative membrane-bound dehydrogenase-like protein